MKKRKWILPVGIVGGVIVLCIVAVFVFGAVLSANGYGISTGRLYFADNGTYLIDSDDMAMLVSDQSDDTELFKGYQNGDRVILFHDGIETTYPSQTGGYRIFRLSKGDGTYKPSDEVLGIERMEEAENKDYPEYSFSFTWNTYGVSSYDSVTGTLIKTKDATSPKDYTTNLKLNNQQYSAIWKLIESFDIDSYPDNYNPHKNGVSNPYMTLILSVNSDGIDKTVTVEETVLSYVTNNSRGQKFLDVCKGIRDILTETDEWKALPEYEFFYD